MIDNLNNHDGLVYHEGGSSALGNATVAVVLDDLPVRLPGGGGWLRVLDRGGPSTRVGRRVQDMPRALLETRAPPRPAGADALALLVTIHICVD